MDPTHTKGAKLARTRYIRKTYQDNPNAIYTDAAVNKQGNASAVATNEHGKMLEFVITKQLNIQEETALDIPAIRWA